MCLAEPTALIFQPYSTRYGLVATRSGGGPPIFLPPRCVVAAGLEESEGIYGHQGGLMEVVEAEWLLELVAASV